VDRVHESMDRWIGPVHVSMVDWCAYPFTSSNCGPPIQIQRPELDKDERAAAIGSAARAHSGAAIGGSPDRCSGALKLAVRGRGGGWGGEAREGRR
jgi:hypothetical protein